MQNVTVNALLITSLLRTSLIHNDYYLKAQSWASLFSYLPLSIFHQKLVATNPVQLLLRSLLLRPWILYLKGF